MGRPPKTPLRALTQEERAEMQAIARAHSEQAVRVHRARIILRIADGDDFTAAARSVGRTSGRAVARMVRRFNKDGIRAVLGRHGGAPPIRYGPLERERILREFARTPEREKDGTATWSLTTLCRAIRRAPDGLPQVSTWTIFHVLHEAGYTWQRSRTWCETGQAERKRKEGVVTVQ